MSSIQTTNIGAQTESKSAKKKKAKAEAAAQSPQAGELEVGSPHVISEPGTNGIDTSSESPYVKELYKYSQLSQYCILG